MQGWTFTTKQMAELLGTTATAVNHWIIGAGVIPYLWASPAANGNTRLFTRSQVLEVAAWASTRGIAKEIASGLGWTDLVGPPIDVQEAQTNAQAG